MIPDPRVCCEDRRHDLYSTVVIYHAERLTPHPFEFDSPMTWVYDWWWIECGFMYACDGLDSVLLKNKKSISSFKIRKWIDIIFDQGGNLQISSSQLEGGWNGVKHNHRRRAQEFMIILTFPLQENQSLFIYLSSISKEESIVRWVKTLTWAANSLHFTPTSCMIPLPFRFLVG